MSAPFGIGPERAVEPVIAAALAEITAAVPARYSDAAIEAPLPRDVFEALWVTGRGLGYEKLFADTPPSWIRAWSGSVRWRRPIRYHTSLRRSAIAGSL